MIVWTRVRLPPSPTPHKLLAYSIYYSYLCDMKINVMCEQCGSIFERENREQNRSLKLNRRTFCSRKCSGKANINNIPIDKISNYDISQHSSNRKDEYTPFKSYLRRIKSRTKEIDIDLEYIKYIWEKQEGICPYSKIKLILCSDGINDPIYTASIDRIDSTKGYIKGNIQFVSTAINYMKHSMTHDETIELINIISKT